MYIFQSTFEIARPEERKPIPAVKVAKRKLSREPGASAHAQPGASLVTPPRLSPGPGAATSGSEPGDGPGEEPIYVNNYDYADLYSEHAKSEESDQASSGTGSGHMTSGGLTRMRGVYSAESDSGLDVTPEGTPYTGSR